MIDAYLEELARSLRVRGRARRRLLAECREHLVDLAGDLGERQAIDAFGEPAAVAAAYDAVVAARRGVTGAWWSTAAVVALGCSTLALIHAADPSAHATPLWAITFAATAQVAMVCAGLLVVQALCLRRYGSEPRDVALLCRRMTVGVAAGGAAMFSAGAALPGHGSAPLLLAGPVLALVAGPLIIRAWLTTRRLPGARESADRSPFADLRRLTGAPVPVIAPAGLATLAAVAAFVRDLGEAGSSLRGALIVAAIEAMLVLLAYRVLRRPLGLRALRAT